MTISRRALAKNRGVAILLALFFMILLSLIGVALIGLVPVELRSATRTKLDVQAHYAVTSGIRHARSWCSAVMTPTSDSAIADFLGDDATTTGNSFYNVGASYYNDITGVNGDAVSVEYRPMTLADVWNNIPRGNSRWASVNEMLNIPASGDTMVDPATVVLCKKDPLVYGDWSVYTVIIPDADTPGGIKTQTGGKITSFFGGAGKAGRRCYQLISIAYYQGFPTLRGKSVVLEDSFARYSLFVDEDPSGGWFLQGLPGQATTNGPVHTNQAFKFAIDPGVWSDTSGKVPFNGLLTFGRPANNAQDGVVESLNKDGAVYSEGNDVAGTSTLNRPFDDGGGDAGGKYFKMISGGRSNLRQTAKVNLPPDSTKIANAAYGSEAVLNQFSTGPVTAHLRSNGTAPDGIFVFDKSDGTAAGGVVIKGDQKAMFLEVLDSTGHPVGVDTVGPLSSTTVIAPGTTATSYSTTTVTVSGTPSVSTLSTTVTASNLSALENGSATGNPAIRVQAKTSQTTLSLTSSTILIPTTITNSSVSTIGSTTITNSSPTSTTSSPTSTATSRSTLYRTTSSPTSTRSNVQYSTNRSSSPTTTITNTQFGTATSSIPTSTRSNFVTFYGTTTFTTLVPVPTVTGTLTSTTGTSYITLGGAGGGRQTVYLTTLIPQTSTSTSTSRNSSSSPTSTRTDRTTLYSNSLTSSPTTTRFTTRFTTFTSSTPTTTRLTTLYQTVSSPTSTLSSFSTAYSTRIFYSTSTATLPLTTNIVSLSVSTSTSTSIGTITVTYKPIDQMIEARNQAVTLSPSMFSSTNIYRRPAGAVGSGSDMDVDYLGDIATFLDASGNPITGPVTVNKGQVVVIKQSRLDPKQAVVFISDATPADDGSLLNGAVLAEGHLGDPTKPGKGGIAGVNMGRKTIGTQIKSPTATGNADPFAPQLDKDDTTLGISNNLFQFGTKRYESNTDNLKAENGLGLVGADVRVTAEAKDFTNFLDGRAPLYDGTDKMLNIHAVILGGSSRDGGLTVNGFTDFNSITPESMGTANGQTPMIRFVGGLILRNYYARVNGSVGREAGWNSKNLYNQQLALKPPPYFPNNGLLIPLSYVEERIWGAQKL